MLISPPLAPPPNFIVVRSAGTYPNVSLSGFAGIVALARSSSAPVALPNGESTGILGLSDAPKAVRRSLLVWVRKGFYC